MNITPNNLPIISNAGGTGIPSFRVTCGVLWGPNTYNQPQNECSIQDCETILRDFRKDIVELKHSVEQLQSIKESEPGMCSNNYSTKPN